MDSSLFSIENLATISSAALAVYLFVQMTKGVIDKIIHIPTDILASIYAFIILILAQIGGGADYRDWKLYFLGALNSLLISMTAAQIGSRASKVTGTKTPNIIENGVILQEDIPLVDLSGVSESNTQITETELSPEDISAAKYGTEPLMTDGDYVVNTGNDPIDTTPHADISDNEDKSIFGLANSAGKFIPIPLRK